MRTLSCALVVLALANVVLAAGWCIGPNPQLPACMEGYGTHLSTRLHSTYDWDVPQACTTIWEEKWVCQAVGEGLGWDYPQDYDLGSTCTGGECY